METRANPYGTPLQNFRKSDINPFIVISLLGITQFFIHPPNGSSI